jgi:broad specificity phosphatase PhoE
VSTPPGGPPGQWEGIFLARHGETDYNRERRFQGWLPVPLNAQGREQAAELAEAAKAYGFRALWCSHLARARETAEIVGQRLGLAASVDPRLAETDAGDWTDLLFSDVHERDPAGLEAFLRADPGFAFPGGESFRAQSERVAAALDDVARGPDPALVICHGNVIRLAVRRARLASGVVSAPVPAVSNAALVPL